MRNPYLDVHRRIRARQRTGPAWVLPLAAAALAMPLARPVLLSFLDGPAIPQVVATGTDAIAFRLGALVASAMALHTYSDLVRGPDRAVLDAHPVQPRLLLTAIARGTARQRSYLPIMGAIVLLPLAFRGELAAYAGAVGVVFGAWLCALGIGFTVHLAAVQAAFSPTLATLLDLLRGDNPRMQAALIYAPGAVLALAGTGVAMASAGVRAALLGWAPGWAFLLLPPALGLVGALLAGPLSERTYVRASALLAEVDAAWAGLEERDEDRRVYLEWMGNRRPELRRALRQGWRRLRTWPMGAWGLGLVGAFAGWSEDPHAAAAVVAVAGGAAALIAAVPTRLAEGDPAWLDEALGVDASDVALARTAVALLYAQGAILPAVASLFVRQGLVALKSLLVLELFAMVASAFSAQAARSFRGQGVLAYAPVAVLAWAAIAGLSWTGVHP